ncbi:hypothetical protein NM688_g7338 [Phlebia brevispora]|uniref:Uncharacterized protein n=1 Tax=Phlebia brevispora TaxID=194682 RepID=A0ACC1S6H2_9APHY|nr:hypothetical protein NM688_g7338 [Phlebia brevispora]
MSSVEAQTTYSSEIKALQSHLDAFASDENDRGGRDDVKRLLHILQDACDLVRRAEISNSDELADVVEEVEVLVKHGITLAHGDCLSLEFFDSFAHENDSVMEDPIKSTLGQGAMVGQRLRFHCDNGSSQDTAGR